ncbi:fibrinogen C domain-containing protein 1-B-like [Mizuhopecten yessoensis]|uniref:Fibrinogen C domain-containing protein 1-B n=1 Tax=Mizuhopecten yessoensis TaxID=6573 RepID=A0A210PIR8_MIZYE|nr:fibrinogen C domain-containing protein 1-B-like [Mizuhopecten yessoensis]OWF36391.1 Fibrinogen C domain-containing protein 1-B [Mizuhopecten yessoensis]
MGESKVVVESGSDAEAKMATKSPNSSGNHSNLVMLLTMLAGAAALGAAVWFPTSELVKELHRLVTILDKSPPTQNPQSGPVRTEAPEPLPRDCYDLYKAGQTSDGLYTVHPSDLRQGLVVYCDMTSDGGGWLTFQRRMDGSEQFKRKWQEYMFGFGDPAKEFWIGNEFLHAIVSQGWYELRIDMEDFNGEKRYATYKLFRISNGASRYRLSVAGYSGDAGDSMEVHNGMMFSTFDLDNDGAPGNCAESFKGGFWYNNCHNANPNGVYLEGEHETLADGVNWHSWRGYKYSMKYIDMKIRPV